MGSGLLLTALHRSGREVPVEIALSPLRRTEVSATVATVRDVTERLETAAQLDEAQTRLEVLDDRDRIARELHDSVIQRLFAAGLHLQASTNRPDTAERVSAVVDEIDEAIREIRGVIFTLHRPAQLDSGLEAALRASINEAARLLGHRPTLAARRHPRQHLPRDGLGAVGRVARGPDERRQACRGDEDRGVARCRGRCGDAASSSTTASAWRHPARRTPAGSGCATSASERRCWVAKRCSRAVLPEEPRCAGSCLAAPG